MFNSGMKEALNGEIAFKEMTVGTFELVLEFVYTGKDIVTRDNVSALLEASSLLQMQALFEKCEDTLLNNIIVDICLETWRLALVFNSEKIRYNAFQFILTNFTTMVEQETIMDLTTGEFIEIVKDDRLKTPNKNLLLKQYLTGGTIIKKAKPM